MITFASQNILYKMSKLFSKLITAVLLLASVGLQAQDAHFSQFYANPLYLNPAMAGTNICPRLAVSFRDHY